jgi:excisionase family DNA binding protein
MRARQGPRPQMLTVKQVAAELQVSTRTVWRWIERNELAVHYFDRSVRISPEDLDALKGSKRAR